MEEKDYFIPEKPTREFCIQCLEDEEQSVRQACIKFLVAELFKSKPLFPLYTKENSWYFGNRFVSENAQEIHSALFEFVDKHDNAKNILLFINLLGTFYQQNDKIPQKEKLLLNFLFKMSAINPQRKKLAQLICLHYDCNSGNEIQMIEKSQDFPELLPVIIRQFRFNTKQLWKTNFSCDYSACLLKLNTKAEGVSEALELLIPCADYKTLACIVQLSYQLAPKQQETLQDKIITQLEKLRSMATVSIKNFFQVAYYLPWEKAKPFYQYWMTQDTAQCLVCFGVVTVYYAQLIGRNSDKEYQPELQKIEAFFELFEDRSYISETIEEFFCQITEPQKYSDAYLSDIIKWLQKYSDCFQNHQQILDTFQHKILTLYAPKPNLFAEVQKLYRLVLQNCPPNALISYWKLEYNSPIQLSDILDCIRNLNLPELPDQGKGINQALIDIYGSAIHRSWIIQIISLINQEYNLNWQLPTDTPINPSARNEYIRKVNILFAIS